MVVFTCAHCGDSVQKPKVEKHYETKCRNKFPDLCCMDCLKDFRGDEFKVHLKCVTEAERYGGKGYVAKPGQNKGEKKQNAWIEIVQNVISENSDLPKSLRILLEKVSNQPNTPRKQFKFVNFIRSLDKRASENDIDRAWKLLSSKLELIKSNPTPPKTENGVQKENNEGEKNENLETSIETSKKRKKEKKTKDQSDIPVTENEETNQVNGETVENNDAESFSSKKKKKGKKTNGISESVDISMNNIDGQTNGVSENDITENGGEENKKTNVENNEAELSSSKKKKKGKKTNGILEPVDNSTTNIGDQTNNVSENSVEKTKKRNRENTSESTENIVNPELDKINKNKKKKIEINSENLLENNSMDVSEGNIEPKKDSAEEKVLSKKERKEKKKREKYEAELKEIESNQIIADKSDIVEIKNKKRKLSENVTNDNQDIVDKEIADAVAEEPKSKKSKASDTFDWTGTISSVLTSKGKEIALKKLQKKVLTEYSVQMNVSEIPERIHKKFMKSLKGIEKVVIENDKVSLSCE